MPRLELLEPTDTCDACGFCSKQEYNNQKAKSEKEKISFFETFRAVCFMYESGYAPYYQSDKEKHNLFIPPGHQPFQYVANEEETDAPADSYRQQIQEVLLFCLEKAAHRVNHFGVDTKGDRHYSTAYTRENPTDAHN